MVTFLRLYLLRLPGEIQPVQNGQEVFYIHRKIARGLILMGSFEGAINRCEKGLENTSSVATIADYWVPFSPAAAPAKADTFRIYARLRLTPDFGCACEP